MRVRSFAGIALVATLSSACTPASTEGEGDTLLGDQEEVAFASDALVVCAPDEVVLGIDVSYYQGTIDWDAVAGDGYAFAIARINHSDFMDPQFDANWAGIKEVGLVRGAYQYFEPGEDPVWQAEVVVDKVGMLGPGDLPVVIDVETTSGLTDKAAIVASIAEWIEIVEAGTGKTPIIYTGKYFWQDNVSSDDFADVPLWHAQYPNACQPPQAPPPTCGCANVADQWSDWLIWQYTSSGSVAGISGNVDTNVFKGDYEDLVAFANQGGGHGASVESIVAPKTVLAGESFAVAITVTNTGGAEWSANTRLGTTEPRDRESAFVDASWIDATRPGAAVATPLGSAFTFELTFTAPSEPGVYVENFGLVEEGVAWFGDEAGPADTAIALSLQVVSDPTGNGSANGGSGPSGPTGNGAGSGEGGEGGTDADADDDGTSCAFSAPRGATPSAALFLVGLVYVARRRRARA